jgi:hypothetical protein
VNLEEFYEADTRRRSSEELEFGSDWDENGARTQVSWIAATGELYAMRDPLGWLATDVIGDTRALPVTDDALTIEVLGTLADRAAATAVMSGWEAAMPAEGSLNWVRDRIAHADTELADPPAQPSRDLPSD